MLVPIVDGEVTLPTGSYEVKWTIEAAVNEAEGPGFTRLFGPFSQELQVGTSREPEDCCVDGQTWTTLTSGNNTLDATLLGPVCVDALAGDDSVIVGGQGNVVLGGPDDDVVDGGDDQDRLFGGDGEDELAGWNNDDLLYGDGGDDVLSGNDGNDTLLGGAGIDRLIGGNGNDTLLPGSGADGVDAGSGDDVIIILHACELVSGEDLDGGSNSDTLYLPNGTTLGDLGTAGVTVSNIETVATLPDGVWGVADCDPLLGYLASE